jgi:hypothetical protein
LGEVGVPAILEVDDLHLGGPGSIEDGGDARNDGGGACDVKARKVDITALGRIGVLHVDDDDGRFVGIHRDRLRPGRQRHETRLAGRCAVQCCHALPRPCADPAVIKTGKGELVEPGRRQVRLA